MKKAFQLAILFVLTVAPHSYSFQWVKTGKVESTDPALRLRGFEEFQRMKASSPFKDVQWQFLGPVNIGGRCTDVAVVAPKGRNYTFYIATASGGVWKTDNEGTTFRPVFDEAASTSIGDVTIAPSDPNIVWVGTGEANIFRSSQAGIGVFKSTDAGKTWKHEGLDNTYTIPRIVIDPKNPDVVYVAASGHEWTDNPDRGVYKTTDGGTSWKKVLFVNNETGAIDLVMDPSNPQTLYAATWQRIRHKWNDPRNTPKSSGSGIYRTTDGGTSWNEVDEGLPEARYRGRIGIDIAHSDPKILYALVDDYQQAPEADQGREYDSYGRPSSGVIKGATVYRSDDGARTWHLVSGLTDTTRKYMEAHSATYGWVFGQVRVDPNDPNTVYTMGLSLNVSNDGGHTFRRLRGMHGDHHGLWIDPDNSNYLLNVNDGGAYVSYDAGKSWTSFITKIHDTQFFDIAYDMATPVHVYGSVQDYGSFRGVVDLSSGRDKVEPVEFEEAPGGEGSTHAVDPTDPSIVYSAGFYGSIERTNLVAHTSQQLLPHVLPDEPKMRGQWVAPFILSPQSPDILYHGMQYLLESVDRGDTWEQISPDLTYNDKSEMGDIPYHTLTAISESPLRHGLLYAGTDDGKVQMTKDGGKHWQEIMNGLPERKWVTRIVASKYDIGTVYMTQSGKQDDDFTPYVWKSTDFGTTWTDIAGGIPFGGVNVIREDPKNRNVLYVGADGGVFVTTDGAKTWNVLGANLPMTYVMDLVIQPRDNMVCIATHGRGIWVLDNNRVSPPRARRFEDEDMDRQRE